MSKSNLMMSTRGLDDRDRDEPMEWAKHEIVTLLEMELADLEEDACRLWEQYEGVKASMARVTTELDQLGS